MKRRRNINADYAAWTMTSFGLVRADLLPICKTVIYEVEQGICIIYIYIYMRG